MIYYEFFPLAILSVGVFFRGRIFTINGVLRTKGTVGGSNGIHKNDDRSTCRESPTMERTPTINPGIDFFRRLLRGIKESIPKRIRFPTSRAGIEPETDKEPEEDVPFVTKKIGLRRSRLNNPNRKEGMERFLGREGTETGNARPVGERDG